MTKSAATRRRRRPKRGSAAAETVESGPARIPGIRVAHIGGGMGAVEEIRAYWQARGAVFLHHSLGPGEPSSRLEEVLERSHVVFHARAGAACELGRSLERYCERRGKPLILLEADSVAAIASALTASLPLT
jgi:hypothetical protein